MPNRLAAEQSPYLLQHANNPVEWYAWGPEAFEKARADDKPIFLSIGYSTCHWCHVMEHESFENAELAAILNRDFVSIKVDREERPDVDRIYMSFVQATTGAGGWPMSVWLTPSLQPFYGGTYFPPSAQWGRPGFRELLVEIARAWREDRENVDLSATSIMSRLAAITQAARSDTTLTDAALADTVRDFERTFDARYGGFGDQPKFPRPTELWFLLREHARVGTPAARDMTLTTLRAMALGGMRDHLGGGFHRYSVDRQWRVPHFEKMLYDQAQLAIAYLEGAQASQEPFFAQVAEDTLQYVARELTDPAGGFYSAEDADSVPPEDAMRPDAKKKEGAFYVWTEEELGQILGEESRVFALRFGVEANGNVAHDPHGEFGRANILYTARGIAEVAAEAGLAPSAVAEALSRARQQLFGVRALRPRPHLDDKVLTAWNGLMLTAFARGARVLRTGELLGDASGGAQGASHLRTAQRAAHFLRTTMWDSARQRLRRRYRGGDVAVDGYAEDYAFAIFGLLELFQADGDADWLDWAVTLQNRMDDLFWDADAAGWFSTTGEDESVLLRLREDYDGAEPSATSVAALNVLTLSHLGADDRYAQQVEQVFAAAGRLAETGRAVPMLAAAYSTKLAGGQQVVLVGTPDSDDARALHRVVHEAYRPFTIVVPVAPGAAQERLSQLLPWIAGMSMRGGVATAYVCRNFACSQPTISPAVLRDQLDGVL